MGTMAEDADGQVEAPMSAKDIEAQVRDGARIREFPPSSVFMLDDSGGRRPLTYEERLERFRQAVDALDRVTETSALYRRGWHRGFLLGLAGWPVVAIVVWAWTR
jgi:hypothetical protein